VKKLIGGGLAALALGLSATVLAPTASAAAVINQDTVAQFIATVNYESDRYGTGYVSVRVGEMDDPRAIAETDGYTITLNTSYAVMSPEQFNANIAEDIATGYQPGGCAGIQAVAIHEMGHVVDEHTGRFAYRSVAAASPAQVGYNLHGYAFENGKINPGEAVAVSFQAVECGSATPTERSIYNLLVS
jgi:hypothetical protein